MKTVVAAINAKYIHSNPAVHLLQKSALAYGKQFQVSVGEIQVREFTINQSLETIYYEIMQERPDIVAFSVYIWNLDAVRSLCQDLKAANPQLEIWLGGPEVSYGTAQKRLPTETYDWVLAGEGERLFYSLLADKMGYTVPEEWQIQKNGKRVTGAFIDNLDELPFIYEDLKPFQNRIIYYEASRGCPFHCAYCLSAADPGVRELPLERVLRELSVIVKQKAPQIKFVDRTFNCHESRALQLLDWIRALPDSCLTNFHFEAEANLLSDALVECLTHMPKGRVQLEIGIQSTYPPALKACGRTAKLDRVFQNIRRLRQNDNINLHVDLIAGLPLEGYERFGVSFDQVYHLKAHQFQLGFLKLLTGAPMNEMIQQYGYVFSIHPPYEILKNHDISPEELYRLKCVEAVLDRLYNSGRFRRFLEGLEREYPGPFAMMEALAGYLEEKGLIFAAISAVQLCDALAGFVQPLAQKEQHLMNLLLDYYTATPSDQIPAGLRELSLPPEDYKNTASALLKRIGKRERKIVVRFCAGAPVAVDYTAKDLVTGQYEIQAAP